MIAVDRFDERNLTLLRGLISTQRTRRTEGKSGYDRAPRPQCPPWRSFSPNTSASNRHTFAPCFHASRGRPALWQVCARNVSRSHRHSVATCGSSSPRWPVLLDEQTVRGPLRYPPATPAARAARAATPRFPGRPVPRAVPAESADRRCRPPRRTRERRAAAARSPRYARYSRAARLRWWMLTNAPPGRSRRPDRQTRSGPARSRLPRGALIASRAIWSSSWRSASDVIRTRLNATTKTRRHEKKYSTLLRVFVFSWLRF